MYRKNFCKCHNVPPPSTIIKKIKKIKKQNKAFLGEPGNLQLLTNSNDRRLPEASVHPGGDSFQP
jgi:hypothetical protein